MEQIFDAMKAKKENTVAKVMKWLQDAGIMDKSKGAEQEVMKHFSHVADKQNISFPEFKGAMEKLSASKKTSLEDTMQKLVANAGGASAASNLLGTATAALGFK